MIKKYYIEECGGFGNSILVYESGLDIEEVDELEELELDCDDKERVLRTNLSGTYYFDVNGKEATYLGRTKRTKRYQETLAQQKVR